MKLSNTLLVALMASMSCAYADSVTTTGVITDSVISSLGSAGVADCYTKEGSGSVTITSGASVSSSIRVLEGTLNIGSGGDTHSSVYISGENPSYYEVLTVGGTNAQVVIDNTTVSCNELLLYTESMI